MLARKFDISMKGVFNKYEKNSRLPIKLQKVKRGKFVLHYSNRLPEISTFLTSSKNLKLRIHPHNTVMFHRRRISNLKLPFTPIVADMIRINRRQIPVYRHCFDLARCGKLEANQIKHPQILLGMENRVQWNLPARFGKGRVLLTAPISSEASLRLFLIYSRSWFSLRWGWVVTAVHLSMSYVRMPLAKESTMTNKDDDR